MARRFVAFMSVLAVAACGSGAPPPSAAPSVPSAASATTSSDSGNRAQFCAAVATLEAPLPVEKFNSAGQTVIIGPDGSQTLASDASTTTLAIGPVLDALRTNAPAALNDAVNVVIQGLQQAAATNSTRSDTQLDPFSIDFQLLDSYCQQGGDNATSLSAPAVCTDLEAMSLDEANAQTYAMAQSDYSSLPESDQLAVVQGAEVDALAKDLNAMSSIAAAAPPALRDDTNNVLRALQATIASRDPSAFDDARRAAQEHCKTSGFSDSNS